MDERAALLWLPTRLASWEPSGEPLEYERRDLQLDLGGSKAQFLAHLAYCRSLGMWLGDLLELVTALAEAELFPLDIESFRLDGEELRVEVWAGEGERQLGWREFAELESDWTEGAEGEELPAQTRLLLEFPQLTSRRSESPELGGERSEELTAGESESPWLPARDLAGLARLNQSWSIAQQPVTFTRGEDDSLRVGFAAVVVTGDDLVRAGTAIDGPFDAAGYYSLLCRACLYPPEGVPAGRPHQLIIDQQDLLPELRDLLEGSQITARQGEVGLARSILDGFREELTPGAPGDYLSTLPAGERGLFLRAAREFIAANPWEVFDPNKYIAFRVGEGRWRYASVIGHEGWQLGLAIFDCWLDLCRFVLEDVADPFEAGSDPFGLAGDYAANGDDTPSGQAESDADGNLRHGGRGAERDAVDAEESEDLEDSTDVEAGEGYETVIEYVVSGELDELSPADAACYAQHDLEPLPSGEYPIIFRAKSGGAAQPTLPIEVYTALLKLLTSRVQGTGTEVSRIAAKVPLEVGLLDVRFPSRGDEEAAEQAWYTFTLPVRDARVRTPGRHVYRVTAPARAKWHNVVLGVQRHTRENLSFRSWIPTLRSEGDLLWFDNHAIKEPSPTVEQVAHLSEAWIWSGESHRLELQRVEPPENGQLEIEWLRKE